MRVFTALIGAREFMVIEDVRAVPIDTIISIDLNAPNGAASDNSVCIYTTENEPMYFAYENADVIRDYLANARTSDLFDRKREAKTDGSRRL